MHVRDRGVHRDVIIEVGAVIGMEVEVGTSCFCNIRMEMLVIELLGRMDLKTPLGL